MKTKKHKSRVKVALLHSSSLSSSASAKSFSSSVSLLHRFPCCVNMNMERSVRMFWGGLGAVDIREVADYFLEVLCLMIVCVRVFRLCQGHDR